MYINTSHNFSITGVIHWQNKMEKKKKGFSGTSVSPPPAPRRHHFIDVSSDVLCQLYSS